MANTNFWQKAKGGSKVGFDKLYGWVDKLGPPVNKLSNKLGSEAFWPTTLDKESDKAARILKSFCKDGFYEEEEIQPADGPKQKQKVLKKIPSQVIKNAKGLAIFTTMRTGLWISGAGGSGILVARKEDGTWSPPSGIMLHTAGLGFLAGVDIYDCVVVINTQKALDAFSKIRCTLGGEVSAVAGPIGAGGVLETELHKRQAPVFTYLKSRGLYAGVQVDGTIVIERTDENEKFYGQRISVGDILAGKVHHAPFETRKLLETIKAAEGAENVDETLLPSPSEPAPGDYELHATEHVFGVPDKEDPDPFGVLALEKAGLEIREAGTRNRVSTDAFHFAPSPKSPIFGTFNRRSIDTHSINGYSHSRRASQASNTDRVASMSDMSTQTDIDEPSSPRPMSAMSNLILNGNRASTQSTIQSRILEQEEPQEDVQNPKATSPTPSLEINGKKAATDDGFEHVPFTSGSAKDASSGSDEPRSRNLSLSRESYEREEKLAVLEPESQIVPSSPEPIEAPLPMSANDTGKQTNVQETAKTTTEDNDLTNESENTNTDESRNSRVNGATHDNHDVGNGHAINGDLRFDTDLEDGLDSDEEADDEDDLEIIEEPVVVQQIQTAPAAKVIPRARLVMVNKPAPPPMLPPRSAKRSRFPITIPSPSGERGSMDQGTAMTPLSPHQPSSPAPLATNATETQAAPMTNIGASIAQMRIDSDDDADKKHAQTPSHEQDEFHSLANSRQPSPKRAPVALSQS